MRVFIPPFQLDLRELIARARRHFNDRISGLEITLPFVTFSVNPEATEKTVAKEIVIRLADRRVLNSFECCDNCIENAIASLQEIRTILVDKQVELSNFTEGALYLLIEFMLESIRQFFTFQQKLKEQSNIRIELPRTLSVPDSRETYFRALEMLRAHLHKCLIQVSTIADIKIPKISDHMRYDHIWQTDAYIKPDIRSGFVTE